MPDPSNLEDWLAHRARLAGLVRQADEAIARLSPPPARRHNAPRESKRAGPYVLVREDGAVYTGRRGGYQIGGTPRPFAYRRAATNRAAKDRLTSALVLRLAEWKETRS